MQTLLPFLSMHVEENWLLRQSSVRAAENKVALTKVLLIYRKLFVTDFLGGKQRENLL